jgi:ferrous iron transport protein B
VLEITDRVVVCLNLMDEAGRHAIQVDCDRLQAQLGVPVVPTSARYGRGIEALLQAVEDVATGQITCRPYRNQQLGDPLHHAVCRLEAEIERTFPGLPNSRWVALRLLDGDARIGRAVREGELEAFATGKGLAAEASETVESASSEGPARALLSLASSLRWQVGPDFHERLVEAIYGEAARIADACVQPGRENAAWAWIPRRS